MTLKTIDTFDTIDIFCLLFAAVGLKKIVFIISTACKIFTLVKKSPSCYWSLCEDQGKINISPLSKEYYKIVDGFSVDDDDLLRAI